ncbi:MAG: cytochrome c biogenesis protein ResB, partial [Helicobacter sp.]|nr:cytochrome c biogenesis protein ResB [Helicobacter sp.]
MNLRNFFRRIAQRFFSFGITIILLLLYACACIVATFLENDYGTASAKAVVYNTQWFDILHLLIILNLIGVFFSSAPWKRKKYASILFHSSLILIFIGAAITRYYGFEGIMHIREGEKSNTFQSQDDFLTVFAKIEDKTYRAFFPTTITPLAQTKFNHAIPFLDSSLQIKFIEYIPAQNKMELDSLKLEATYKNYSEILQIEKNQ